MNSDSLVNEVMDRLKDEGYLMIPDDFIDQLIITLHSNVTAINTLTELVKVENEMLVMRGLLPTGNRQVESLKGLAIRIAEIAFNVEDVRDEQR